MKKIGCFISSHGFGHATRTCGVLEALCSNNEVLPHLFTTVNESLFQQSGFNYIYHRIKNDIGFIQNDAFQLDMEKTISGLKEFIPFDETIIDELADVCRDFSFILCDISALGIKVGEKANIPSVLLENFTWDWLYSPHEKRHPELAAFSEYLRHIYTSASYHIQTEPVCRPAEVDLHCGPIYRNTRAKRNVLAEYFGHPQEKVVLITMGGIGYTPTFLDKLIERNEYFFIIAGQDTSSTPAANIHILDRSTPLHHPDLIAFADLTVFKGGYSTLAECYQAGKPCFCIQRPGFAESAILENYLKKKMGGSIISHDDFISGNWLELLDTTKNREKNETAENGAELVSQFLQPLL